MAQFVGTGKGGFVKGQPFDIPDSDTQQQELIEERGHGERVSLLGQTGPPDPARRAVELADADLRDDPLSHPQDRQIADSMSEDQEREIDAQHHTDAVPKGVESKVKTAAKDHPAEAGEGRGSSAATRRSGESKAKS